MEPYLRTLAAEERAVMERMQHALNLVATELRHEWSEDVAPEHEAWREVSLAAKAVNDRACIWGRHGIAWGDREERAFDLQPVREVASAFIDGALAALIPNYAGAVWRIPCDARYFLVQPDDVAKIIGWDWLDQKDYIAERFDCEDFAIAFKGRFNTIWNSNCVGIVIDWSSFHGYNVIVPADGVAWLYEPQNDCVAVLGDLNYKLTEGVILI